MYVAQGTNIFGWEIDGLYNLNINLTRQICWFKCSSLFVLASQRTPKGRLGALALVGKPV